MNMLSFNALLDFSRCNCVGICASLVPINILSTALSVYKVSRGHSPRSIHISIGFSSLAAVLLALHDLSWLIIGVIMAPTYILFTIAMVCLGFNAWAGCHPRSMRQTVLTILGYGQRGLAMLWPRSQADY
ncbi:hypothetical protein HRE53_18395 [Acaryochloris sp. 'Moss Beach']|uniref:hypothetical protein n=1 Tax=Acaryochloris sp. 'Moss Beach' TaxID=2740837 RepID=UPI001F343652|nr:hypothetical protein [Acaryochloris sp. 'Moss Beach']UJB68482.1 hypothetical protein HRE53_18395 [Acaryochloris sp. 'Moss Beach']